MIALALVIFLLSFNREGQCDAQRHPQIPRSLYLRSEHVTAAGTNYGNSTSAGSAITAAATTTAAAKYHCDYRGEDPDGGIASPFCECGEAVETESWPLLTPTAWTAQNDVFLQCAYTAMPVSTNKLLASQMFRY